MPDIATVTTAGSTVNVDVPFTIKDRKALPKGLQASVRWDPIALSIAPVDPATEVAPGSAGSAPAAPGAKPSAAPSSAPAAKAPPGVGPRRKAFIDAPVQAADLVVPETAGDVIAPTAAKVGKSSFTVPVTLPSVPGHYRLTVTLHDGEGEAYDDATQAMLPSLNVRVTGDYDMAVDVVPGPS